MDDKKGRVLIGIYLPTYFGGKARITDYDPGSGLYLTASGLWWKLERGTLNLPPQTEREIDEIVNRVRTS